MIDTAYYRHKEKNCPNCGTVVDFQKDYTKCPLCETIFTKYMILEGGKQMDMENN